jgi:tetratricopeptide (TPR) repeat protein
VELDAGDAAALSKLGVVRMRTGQAQDAIGLFRRAVESDPKNAEALLYLAGALASSGRPAEAVPYFERASRRPRTPMALNGLGLTRLELGDRAGRPRPSANRCASPKQPNVAAALRELGGP